ncbi:protein transport protein Sec61 alpha subunit isoform 1 [Reticulomyxa filosa]|uniref:Protein transport protein Sec61 alpha subunit isoform 1 n=1 Tax=Reticulomyxa filosa TaxID=46433 RepID=X6M0I5_RETFI|nr:protein transport protein Sec61 alpha subunit isoform 1 [Reticulomyxa filosa]|eukprot:ETO06485.1 protein transport protein Sec61 alpha subunit isoform 1 [Reticulomyxa filosa]
MPQTSKIFYQLKPLLQYVPSIEPPEKRVPLQDKLFWTLGCLLVFLVASQTGLYGIRIGDKTPDPWYWFRAVLASNRGTLMELGISPVVTSSLVMQLLIGSRLLHVDYSNKEDSALYTSAQKLCAIVITVGEALAYVVSGKMF